MSTLQSRDELSWQHLMMRVGIVIVCTIIIVLAMPRSSAPQYNSKVGSPWTQAAVTATFDFDIPKDSVAYKAECDGEETFLALLHQPSADGPDTGEALLGAQSGRHRRSAEVVRIAHSEEDSSAL